ncbi:MAG TPA: alpha/beta hydrolase [Roseiarcus sp.]|nr:alpha/beta hydrolase [Roseiarcus sp.]
MPYAQAGKARIYFETRGAPDGAPALFIEGFGVQMIGWRERFLRKFVDRGVHVAVFDNRDVGLSQKFGGAHDFDGGYALEDMADDAFGVMDALEWDSAHVVGQSMGGMIAQLMAVRRPERVRSLCLFYAAPGLGPYRKPRPKSAGPAELFAYRSRGEAIEAFVERERVSQSAAYRFDEAWVREWASRSFERAYAPDGVARQAAALGRIPDRMSGVDGLKQPAIVIHGRDDRHLDVAAAFDLGRVLANSEVHVYPGMGHELVEPLWDEWATMIRRTMARADL